MGHTLDVHFVEVSGTGWWEEQLTKWLAGRGSAARWYKWSRPVRRWSPVLAGLCTSVQVQVLHTEQSQLISQEHSASTERIQRHAEEALFLLTLHFWSTRSSPSTHHTPHYTISHYYYTLHRPAPLANVRRTLLSSKEQIVDCTHSDHLLATLTRHCLVCPGSFFRLAYPVADSDFRDGWVNLVWPSCLMSANNRAVDAHEWSVESDRSLDNWGYERVRWKRKLGHPVSDSLSLSFTSPSHLTLTLNVSQC